MFTFSKDYFAEIKTIKSTITFVEINKANQIKSDTVLKTQATIRLYDGKDWKEKTISDVRDVQETMDRMIDLWEKEKASLYIEERLSTAQKKELQEKKQRIFQNVPGRSGRNYHFGDRNITHIPLYMKQNMCKDFHKSLLEKDVNGYMTRYEDSYSSISVIDSNGHDLLFDEQKVIISLCKEHNVEEMCNIAGAYFDEVAGQKTEWQSEISRILDKES